MNVFDAIVNRRSVRSYTGEPLTAGELDKILTAANCAPVGMGQFGTKHLTVITNKDMLAEIEQATAKLMGKPDLHPLYNAPAMVLVSVKLPEGPMQLDMTNILCSDAAIVVQNMALEAVELGLGTCHIWGAVRAIKADAALSAKLGIPEGYTPVCSAIFGKSDKPVEPREPRRNKFTENVID